MGKWSQHIINGGKADCKAICTEHSSIARKKTIVYIFLTRRICIKILTLLSLGNKIWLDFCFRFWICIYFANCLAWTYIIPNSGRNYIKEKKDYLRDQQMCFLFLVYSPFYIRDLNSSALPTTDTNGARGLE